MKIYSLGLDISKRSSCFHTQKISSFFLLSFASMLLDVGKIFDALIATRVVTPPNYFL